MPCSLPEHGASTSTFAKVTTTDSWLPCLHSPTIHAICGQRATRKYDRASVGLGASLGPLHLWIEIEPALQLLTNKSRQGICVAIWPSSSSCFRVSLSGRV